MVAGPATCIAGKDLFHGGTMFAAVRGGAGPTVLLMRGPWPLAERIAGLMLIRADSPVQATRPERYLPSGAGLESKQRRVQLRPRRCRSGRARRLPLSSE